MYISKSNAESQAIEEQSSLSRNKKQLAQAPKHYRPAIWCKSVDYKAIQWIGCKSFREKSFAEDDDIPIV